MAASGSTVGSKVAGLLPRLQVDMVYARSPVGQDCFWDHGQAGLELGYGATFGSTVEYAGSGSITRGEDGCGSCHVPEYPPAGPQGTLPLSLGGQDCL